MRRSLTWPRACVWVIAVAGTACAGGEPGSGVARQQEVSDWKIFNVADTNRDNLSDLLWASASTNSMAVWLMDGAHVLAPGAPIPGPPGDGWSAVTAADFNHDNMNDVIWTNATRGTMAVWLLTGTELLAAGPEIPGPPGDGWVVGNASDTNGDGMADAVWYNATTNQAAVWLMNGTELLTPGPVLPGPPGDGWHVTNIADTNADNRADILWDNPKRNAMAVYLLDGARVLAAGSEIPAPPGNSWSAVTAADFNHDNMNDVIWTKPGQMAVWLLCGSRLLAGGPPVPGPPGDGWTIAYAGDTNGDGMADAVWQKAGTSDFAVWLMNGAELLAKGPVLTGP